MFPQIFREIQIAYAIWEGGCLRQSLAVEEELLVYQTVSGEKITRSHA
jgi:hypothetical protein